MGSSRILDLVFDNGRDCRRQWPRQPMILSARLMTVTSDRLVRIRDLSSGGARIEGEDLPDVGTDVMLKRGEIEVFGTIAWISDNQAGIDFEELLDQGAVDAIQQARMSEGPAPIPELRRAGFGRKLSSHARWSNGRGWTDG